MNIAVLGPSGRMGRLVADRVALADDIELTGLFDRAESDLDELHGVKVESDAARALAGADAYIDFTTPQATASFARAALRSETPAVIGTTGLTADATEAIAALSLKAPVLLAANFSLGVNLLAALVETASRSLGATYDAEIVELHHRRKRDAPSGTAIALGEAVARGQGTTLEAAGCYERHGDVGPRPAGEIGIQTVRGGDIVGEHTVFLIGETERLELCHRATDRALFAEGAIAAARWLAGRAPGNYQMRDVLGLT